ncbi:MAG: M48 family metalloprotease [Chitinispirillaceae bacterium]|nr:M48 family metalloprotease [Chitinispirillaceae bacterium]
MDFFTRQENARKKTGVLVVCFIIAVLLIIAALYGAIAAVLLFNNAIKDPFEPELLAGISIAIITLVAGASAIRMKQLAKGGSAVAKMLGAQRVESDTLDIKEKQLLNVVEEMAIASGTIMPSVYLLEEQGINAFAAGWKSTDAVICVTRGCLELLSRDELQGVIAHEFSHVHSGDMRLNIRLMGFIFGILVIGQIGYWVLRGSTRSRVRVRSRGKGKGAGLVVLLAAALLVIGYIGVFFGNLIKAAVSRAREYLADASAVQFTRNPSGIAGALKKIGGYGAGSRVTHHNAAQASHLFFANGLSGFWSAMFATHPPLEQRIKAIEPGFDGRFPQVAEVPAAQAASESHAAESAYARDTYRASQQRFSAGTLLASVGSPAPEHVAHAVTLINRVPNRLRLAMMDRIGAQAAIVALLLSEDTKVRARQIAMVQGREPRIVPRIEELEQLTAGLDRNLYAIVCSRAINALRSMDQDQYELFSTMVTRMIEADQRIDLFEYMLMRMIKRHLGARFRKNVAVKPSIQKPAAIAEQCAVVLSALAWETAGTRHEAEKAFAHGLRALPDLSGALVAQEACAIAALDMSLETLDRLVPLAKKQVLEACVAVASIDGQITLREAEYLRVIADALECPIPPVLGK